MHTLLMLVIALAGSLGVHWAERRGRQRGAQDVLARRAVVYLFDLAALGMALRSVGHQDIQIAGTYAGYLSVAGMFLLSPTCFVASAVVWLHRLRVQSRSEGSRSSEEATPDRSV